MPKDWWGGILESWKTDSFAAFLVALVALPLALGIALASEVPPMSGVIAVVVGGVVTTLVRSGHVGINGPTPGLITVVAAAVISLKDPDGKVLPYVFAAVVAAGVLQIVMGLLKMGSVANYFPSSVINGLLAAIGCIIIAKQSHVALGSPPAGGSALNEIFSLPDSLVEGNPFVAAIAVLSILILIFHPRIRNRLIHFVPAPMWVLVISIPLAHLFGFFEPQSLEIAGKPFKVGPHFLVDLPENLLSSLIYPDFAKIGQPAFWLVVISICLIGTVETLSSTKAVDRIDPYKRKTDLNRDLLAVGLATVVSGCLGGLPVITVIVRSSVNVNHGGRTRWANFYHGSIVAAFVLLLPQAIQQVPLAALSGILIFTGYKLASPKLFKDTIRFGNEQLLILLGTLFATLKAGLLVGLIAGITFALVIHWLFSGMTPADFFLSVLKPDVTTEDQGETLYIKCRGLCNFLTLRAVVKQLKSAPPGGHVVVDLAHTKLTDYTTMEFLHYFNEEYSRDGGQLEVVESSGVSPSTDHPFSLRRVTSLITTKARLTARQRRLQSLCRDRGWKFRPEVTWRPRSKNKFHFFETRPVEYAENTIIGNFPDLKHGWEVRDITFDEGAFFATEEHHMTILTMELPDRMPIFAIEKAELIDRILEYTGYQEADFVHHSEITKEFEIKAPEDQELKSFFNEELLDFLRDHDLYHVESNGKAVMVFKLDRLASALEVEDMVEFAHEFEEIVRAQRRGV